jgi:hypothetical protein
MKTFNIGRNFSSKPGHGLEEKHQVIWCEDFKYDKFFILLISPLNHVLKDKLTRVPFCVFGRFGTI